MSYFTGDLDKSATGFQVFRHDSHDNLLSYEPVQLLNGNSALLLLLNRAAISGDVVLEGGPMNYIIDLIDSDGDMVQSASLNKTAFNYLIRKFRPKRI